MGTPATYYPSTPGVHVSLESWVAGPSARANIGVESPRAEGVRKPGEGNRVLPAHSEMERGGRLDANGAYGIQNLVEKTPC